MKVILKYFAICLTLGFFLLSCEHEAIEPDPISFTPGTDPTPGSDLCDTNRVYFVNDILPLIRSNCSYSPCHDQDRPGNKGVILTEYDRIIKYGEIESTIPMESELFERITEDDLSKVMPPSGAMSFSDIDKIRKWIEQGFENDSCNSCDTNSFSYSKVIFPIISDNCIGCHSGGTILLTNYSQIKAQADNGKLLGSISHSPGFRAMPQGQPKLSDCKITQVRKWIEAGSPNN